MSILIGRHAAQNEREQRGYRWFWIGQQGPNVAAPPQVADRILVRQEQPWHPPGQFMRAGVQGPNVRVPVLDTIMVRQELPSHPSSQFRTGIQGPNVAPPNTLRSTIIVGQEQPWHPRSFLWSAPPPVVKQLPYTAPLIQRQHQPWHPGAFFHAGTPPVAFEDIQFFIIV